MAQNATAIWRKTPGRLADLRLSADCVLWRMVVAPAEMAGGKLRRISADTQTFQNAEIAFSGCLRHIEKNRRKKPPELLGQATLADVEYTGVPAKIQSRNLKITGYCVRALWRATSLPPCRRSPLPIFGEAASLKVRALREIP